MPGRPRSASSVAGGTLGPGTLRAPKSAQLTSAPWRQRRSLDDLGDPDAPTAVAKTAAASPCAPGPERTTAGSSAADSDLPPADRRLRAARRQPPGLLLSRPQDGRHEPLPELPGPRRRRPDRRLAADQRARLGRTTSWPLRLRFEQSAGTGRRRLPLRPLTPSGQPTAASLAYLHRHRPARSRRTGPLVLRLPGGRRRFGAARPGRRSRTTSGPGRFRRLLRPVPVPHLLTQLAMFSDRLDVRRRPTASPPARSSSPPGISRVGWKPWPIGSGSSSPDSTSRVTSQRSTLSAAQRQRLRARLEPEYELLRLLDQAGVIPAG